VLVATAAKFNIPEDRVKALWSIMMGRAPQQFLTDGYAQKTIKEKFDLIREGWMEQIKTDPRVRYTDIRACTEVDLRDSITKISKPALIFAGAEDPITTVADAEIMKNRINGSRLEVIADAGHMIPREQPEAVNAAIEKFLAEIR
jgi:3-oxoadipate enol-lactonase